MNHKKKLEIGMMDWVQLVPALLLFIGLMTFLQPCGPKEDGSWMTCHWAGRAAAGVAGAMLVLAVLRLFVRGGAKMGLDLASVVLAVLALLIPGRLIGLCMMDTMRCHSVMTPGITVLSVLVLAAAAADMILRRKKSKT